MNSPQQKEVNAVRVVTVTKDGLQVACSSLFDRLGRMSPDGFVAIDTEFSGLGEDADSRHDNLQKRYAAIRRIAHTRAIFSIGISIFNPTTATTETNNTTEVPDSTSSAAKTYEVATYDMLLSCQSPYEMTPSAGSFLEAHGFDFNRMFRIGIPYIRAAEVELKKQRDDKKMKEEGDDGVNPAEKNDKNTTTTPSREPFSVAANEAPFIYGSMPRGLLWRIGRHGVPIIVHNGLFDLVFLYAAVQGALPLTLNEFVGELLECVPAGFWDSKVLASGAPATERATYLSYLFAKSVLNGNVSVGNAPGLPSACMANPPEVNDVRKRMPDALCALYAFRGFCPRGTNCPFAHDAFRVVEEERNGKSAGDSREAHRRHKEQSKRWKRFLSDSKTDNSKLNKKQRRKLVLGMESKPDTADSTSKDGENDREMKDVSDPVLPTASPIHCETVDEVSKKAHTAGWDAFCTGYIFASYRATLSTTRLHKEHNYIALPSKLSNLLLRKSEYADLDTS